MKRETHGMPVRVRFPIRWEETDMAGVVFYGNFFRFFELAEDELYRARGRTRLEVLNEFNLWLPRVEAHAEFVRPARYGDVVEIVARVASMGSKIIRFEFELYRVEPGPEGLLVRGYTVVACVSRAEFRAVPIPPALRRLLEGEAVPGPGAKAGRAR